MINKTFENSLFKNKVFLFLQFCRSVLFFFLIYIFVYKLTCKRCIILLINIFSIYCIFIIILFIFDTYFLLERMGHIYFYDIQRASENIRLRGFFDDPNFLCLFACFFISVAIYLNLSFYYIFFFGVTIFINCV